MTNYDVVKKLIGPIEPVGETYEDEVRLANLRETLEIAGVLIEEIMDVSANADRVEDSAKDIGKKAKKFLENLLEDLYEWKS